VRYRDHKSRTLHYVELKDPKRTSPFVAVMLFDIPLLSILKKRIILQIERQKAKDG